MNEAAVIFEHKTIFSFHFQFNISIFKFTIFHNYIIIRMILYVKDAQKRLPDFLLNRT